MGKTLTVAADRAFDQTKTVLPAELARGVYMRNAPSLRALKLMHLMIATAAGRMADPVQHQMRLADIRSIDGMAHHDKESLKPLFEELRAAVLTYDDPEAMRYTVGGLLDNATVDYRHEATGDVLVSWYFGRMFLDMAKRSNIWAILDRQTVFHLTSKYSVLLFQHISSLTKQTRVHSKTFTIAELRAVLGIPEGKIQRFANLKKDVLDLAIAEINQLSRLTLTATPRKVGRTVTSVEIAWEEKPEPAAPPQELAARKAGGAARPAKAAAVAFPATGTIAYSPHWLVLKHAAGCNQDNALVASNFRRFLADRGISLDAANVEKLFSDYCRKVGNV
jgi:hypothetical protein